VLADGVVVGRIMKAAAAPVGMPWFGHHEDRAPTHSYAATREAAMAQDVLPMNCLIDRENPGEVISSIAGR
jgi:hypothetical protein